MDGRGGGDDIVCDMYDLCGDILASLVAYKLCTAIDTDKDMKNGSIVNSAKLTMEWFSCFPNILSL